MNTEQALDTTLLVDLNTVINYQALKNPNREELTGKEEADRLHDFAGGADRSGHHDRAARGISNLAAKAGSDAVEFAHAALGIVQLQPAGIAAEGVGQEDVRPRLHRAAIEGADAVGVVDVPKLRRLTRGEAHVEQVRPRRPVGGGGDEFGQHHGDGLQRFGFHGLNHQHVAGMVPVARLISCHLGAGCSLAAIRSGRSVDTSMGFTPLEGLVMRAATGEAAAESVK